MYTFLHTPPGGVYFQYFRYIRRQFVCEGIYIQETASRNHILAGYELFMSIYNLQTRTGLNNYVLINFILRFHHLFHWLRVGPRH